MLHTARMPKRNQHRLYLTASLANVLVLKKDGKDVTYYLDGAKSKAFHKNLCQGVHTTKVEGKLSEKDGKSIIDVTAIELVK